MKPVPAGAQRVGTVTKLRALARIDWHPEIEKRRPEFDELVNKLVRDHRIDDDTALARAIDMAIRRYDDKDVLSKRDAALLLKHIPKLKSVLLRKGNDKRIADLLVRREDARIRGGTYDPGHHGQTILRVFQIGMNLAELESGLKDRPSRRRPTDVRLHSAILVLGDYWRDLPGKRFARTFTPKDKKSGRPLAKSEAMRFIEEVVRFIDPAAVPKLPSATRRRLRGIAKIDT
jgi:hypothetical protein